MKTLTGFLFLILGGIGLLGSIAYSVILVILWCCIDLGAIILGSNHSSLHFFQKILDALIFPHWGLLIAGGLLGGVLLLILALDLLGGGEGAGPWSGDHPHFDKL